MTHQKIVKYNQLEPKGLALRTQVSDVLRKLDDDRARQILNIVEALNIFDNRENIRMGDLGGHRPELIAIDFKKSKLAAIVQGYDTTKQRFWLDINTLFDEPSDAEN